MTSNNPPAGDWTSEPTQMVWHWLMSQPSLVRLLVADGITAGTEATVKEKLDRYLFPPDRLRGIRDELVIHGLKDVDWNQILDCLRTKEYA